MKRIVLSRVDRQIMRDIPRIASICLGIKTFTNVVCTAAEYKVCITKGTMVYEFALPRFSTETDTFQSALIQNIREFANANKLYMARRLRYKVNVDERGVYYRYVQTELPCRFYRISDFVYEVFKTNNFLSKGVCYGS